MKEIIIACTIIIYIFFIFFFGQVCWKRSISYYYSDKEIESFFCGVFWPIYMLWISAKFLAERCFKI